jgi:hypothetical protein
VTHAAQLIRDAAMEGDFIRASDLYQRRAQEIALAELSELIAIVRQSAAGARSHAWVAKAYRPGAGERP